MPLFLRQSQIFSFGKYLQKNGQSRIYLPAAPKPLWCLASNPVDPSTGTADAIGMPAAKAKTKN